jgi:hypothetical protein
MVHSKPSAIGTAGNVQSQDQALSQQDYGQAQNTLSQFEGPVQSSPYYKSLVATGTDATSNAYQSALEQQRANAAQGGFGYEQPVTQGAETGVAAQEAGALARIPAQAAQQASGAALQAAGTTAGMGEAAGSQANQALSTELQGQEFYDQMQNQFLQNLAGAGSNLIQDNPWGVFGA